MLEVDERMRSKRMSVGTDDLSKVSCQSGTRSGWMRMRGVGDGVEPHGDEDKQRTRGEI
jgi:hypothetical protein